MPRMSEPDGFRVALVAGGRGTTLQTTWFVEIGQVHGQPVFAEVGGDDEDYSTSDVLARGHTVRWYRLQPIDAPDEATRR